MGAPRCSAGPCARQPETRTANASDAGGTTCVATGRVGSLGCDIEGLSAWLETTEEPTTGFSERFGLETIAAIAGGMALPGLRIMRREPRPHMKAPPPVAM